MLLIVILLIARPEFVVVLILFADYTKWWISAQISTDCFVVGLPNEFSHFPLLCLYPGPYFEALQKSH